MRGGFPCVFIVIGALLSISSVPASAAGSSFTGSFSADNQTQAFSFQATSPNVVIRSLGYAGGTNFLGTQIPRGGFDTVLSLFGPDGALIATTPLLQVNNDGAGGPNCTVPVDPVSGAAFDACIDTGNIPTLSPLIVGQFYFVVLTESDSIPLGGTFGAGFSEQLQGNFTTNFGCGAGPFQDVTCTGVRTGNWAVDITGGATNPQQLGGQIGNNSTTIPTLSEWGMILFTAALLIVGARYLRRPRTT